ncbi:MAG: cytochrome c-type biogenesis protein CcmH [Defluviicoccus sp.]|nr:cytochrome c-type biogenesis protein CcmH [Defluviicoccus sp.]MDG4593191.1 cytochrome c-type biogenesis protein CcmH [Defluviicoccus sp.]MDS4012064.1 cytochrome c-type biogenesis protein [Defluviicoccus sp.]MDS4073320.1 cytochrome c-type biogenesis protein [Defluviicoccus sp.]
MADRRAFAARLIGALLAVLLLAPVLVTAASAVEPDEIVADPAIEARARAISKGLRCLVCQNESIDESNAELARDLRLLVRQRLQAGDSDQAVTAYIVSRYGDFVLLDPPFKAATYALWLGPLAIAAFALGFVFVFYRRRAGRSEAAPLSADDERRLAKLLDRNDP